MPHVALGSVSYLNARPLVYGLDRSPRFTLRFDIPSRCADLLHAGTIDVGLIPSIEYLRPPPSVEYAIVPDLAIASHGPVASVAIYTTRPIGDVRSMALDTSSRTSVALARVLCARVFKIRPALHHRGPDLSEMLTFAEAALVIGDNALVREAGEVALANGTVATVEKIDLGDVWTTTTGLPFVYACWVGRAGALTSSDVQALQRARDLGVENTGRIASDYFQATPALQAIGERYLRDNIQYAIGPEARAGLELFYRYAVESGVVDEGRALRFF